MIDTNKAGVHKNKKQNKGKTQYSGRLDLYGKAVDVPSEGEATSTVVLLMRDDHEMELLMV